MLSNQAGDQVLTLTYHPVAMEYDLSDPMLAGGLRDFLRVPNPNYPDPFNVNEPPFVEFLNPVENRIYTGLLPAVRTWADRMGLRVKLMGWPTVKAVVRPSKGIIPGIVLEDYQLDSIRKCIKHQRGVLEIATGGGKTEVAIGVILALGKPKTLYVVPSLAAVAQMRDRFRLRGIPSRLIGVIAEDECSPERQIVVACIVSLYSAMCRADGGVLRLLEGAKVLFLDEVHHEGTAFTWQAVAAACLADVRIGMSGTPYKDNLSRFNPAYMHPYDSYLTGYTGPTLVYLPPWCLQEIKRLAPCEIHPFPAGGHRVNVYEWAGVYEEGVIQNERRNRRILNLISNLVDAGARPLLSVGYLEHGRYFQRELLRMGIITACSYGMGVLIVPRSILPRLPVGIKVTPVPIYEADDDLDPASGRRTKKRKRKVIGEEDGFVHIPVTVQVDDMLLKGLIQAIIGSKIYDEVLDLPCLTDLVNVGGGGLKSQQRHRQKIGRILRTFGGKRVARIWDPWDECHPFLRKQSKERLQIAREEGYAVVVRPALECFFRFRDLQIHFRHERENGMKLKEIYLEASLSIPVGNYNMLKPVVGLRGEIEEGETPEEAFEKLQRKVMTLFMSEVMHLATADQDLLKQGAHLQGVVNEAIAYLRMMTPTGTEVPKP